MDGRPAMSKYVARDTYSIRLFLLALGYLFHQTISPCPGIPITSDYFSLPWDTYYIRQILLALGYLQHQANSPCPGISMTSDYFSLPWDTYYIRQTLLALGYLQHQGNSPSPGISITSDTFSHPWDTNNNDISMLLYGQQISNQCACRFDAANHAFQLDQACKGRNDQPVFTTQARAQCWHS